MKETEKIHVGTSGWHYKHWMKNFYLESTKPGEMLGFYSELFSTVEINNSFYKLPHPETFLNWKNTVPETFMFSVKANRYITHMKKLIVDAESINTLFDRVAILEEQCGPVLFQLPPNWKVNTERLATFLAALPHVCRCTFEFRHPSWHCEEVYMLLRGHNCSFCIYDIAGFLSPIVSTADFVYIRLHGPGNKYQGSYTEKELAAWAGKCKQWAAEGKDTFIYFDNDQRGFAVANALTLNDMIASPKK